MKQFNFISISSNSDCFVICVLELGKLDSIFIEQITSKRAFELVRVDTWGPYKVPTYNDFKYFLTIVDDFSIGIWTFLLSTKGNAFAIFLKKIHHG